MFNNFFSNTESHSDLRPMAIHSSQPCLQIIEQKDSPEFNRTSSMPSGEIDFHHMLYQKHINVQDEAASKNIGHRMHRA